MKRMALILLFVACQFAAVSQQYWQQELHYTIDVTLNDREHTLDGFLKLRYINHSPDSLSFIWFHLWPNAFKNDKTAFTEQTLQNGRIDFYFAKREERGYINRLDFRVNNNTLETEDHPQYIDIIKVYLPEPLAPGAATEITTPFHVQIPKNFSRGGYANGAYQITQWYPKPAVYDRTGWHPMPYLDQGEFYSEFGSYDVRITVPEAYVVAATGDLIEGKRERSFVERKIETPLLTKPSAKKTVSKKPVSKKPAAKKPVSKKPTTTQKSSSPPALRTLRFQQAHIHDFAWFADTAFIILHDTIQLNNRVINAYSFFRSQKSKAWQQSIQYIKDAVRFRSQLIGEYPYNTISVVEAKMGFEGGMEYPTITSISPGMGEKDLDMIIEHEIGHNWFYGILASNERDYPWMDEGINTYYDRRYEAWKYPSLKKHPHGHPKIPDDEGAFAVAALTRIKEDQPVTTASPTFTHYNYGVIAYYKTALLLEQMEKAIGRTLFDSCMAIYYQQWKFKHPYPHDFQQLLQSCSGKDLTSYCSAMNEKGPVVKDSGWKKIKPAFLFNFRNYDKVNYMNMMPALGYNKYDGLALGWVLHNYTQPAHRFQYFLAPMYGTESRRFNGAAHLSYTWRPHGAIKKIEAGIGGNRFSINEGNDSSHNKVTEGVYRIAPSLRITFRNASPRSTLEKWLEWKTFIIGEQHFRYALKQSDGNYYPYENAWASRYLNQLSFNITDYRALYPYDVLLQVQQGDGFYRATATGHYFFNYGNTGGLQMRVFAAKFGYIGAKTLSKEISTRIYHPKLTAVRGYEDYTYSNYFFGRSETDGLAGQQMMMRDGGLKLRTDLFQGLQGRSHNWVAAMNLSSSLPNGMLPFNFPLKLFLDIGTYADAWKKDAYTSRFLYVGGLQLSLFKNLLNIYAPLLYSKEFRDNLKTVPEENTFGKKISFSIDIHRFNLRKITGNKIPF
jgi:hypothetical protein